MRLKTRPTSLRCRYSQSEKADRCFRLNRDGMSPQGFFAAAVSRMTLLSYLMCSPDCYQSEVETRSFSKIVCWPAISAGVFPPSLECGLTLL